MFSLFCSAFKPGGTLDILGAVIFNFTSKWTSRYTVMVESAMFLVSAKVPLLLCLSLWERRLFQFSLCSVLDVK